MKQCNEDKYQNYRENNGRQRRRERKEDELRERGMQGERERRKEL